MKLACPKLSTDLEYASLEMMIDDGELESVRLHGENGTNCNIAALQLIDVLIEDVQFTGAQFSRIVARDVVFRKTDLSLSALDNGALVRVEFVSCRMSKADLSRTTIHDVTFRDCKMDGVNFTKSDMRRAVFKNSVLDGADFTGAALVDIER
jgi:uncharacterized protein YjbI with pentapeptide repeats